MSLLQNAPFLLAWLMGFLGILLLRDFLAHRIVRRWAAKHGYTELRFGAKPPQPFPGKRSRQQEVFYVRWTDAKGRERGGWVLCGDFWWGVVVEKVSIWLDR